MALKRKENGRQWPLVAELVVNLGADTAINIGGVEQGLNAAGAFDILPLPPGAVVIGGDLTVETISNGATTHTLALGDAGSATRYLTATDLKTAARTAIALTGFRHSGEDLRVTIAATGAAATAGRASLRLMYIVQDRANENQPN